MSKNDSDKNFMQVLQNVEIDLLSDCSSSNENAVFSFQALSSLSTTLSPTLLGLQSMVKQSSNQMNQLFKFDNRGHIGNMTQLKDKSGYLSTITKKGEGIVGQGAFIPVDIPFDPSTMLVAIALYGIEKKLNDIQETQVDILEFLELKERSKLHGNLSVLTEILTNFKHNWNNDSYKKSKYILVQEIKRDSEHSIIFHKERIKKKLAKNNFIQNDHVVNKRIDELISEMKDYQTALYIFAYSDFLELLLLENYDTNYISNIIKKNESYSFDYRKIYSSLYTKIENDSKSTINAKILSGTSGINKSFGKVLSKVPKIASTNLDKAFIDSGKKIDTINDKRSQDLTDRLLNLNKSVIKPFISNFKMIDYINRDSTSLIFDSENIYLVDHFD